MNDFTKEELEEIMVLIMDRRNSLADFLPLNATVLKIIRMIDNYCEHELDGIDGVTGQQCIKCEEWFD